MKFSKLFLNLRKELNLTQVQMSKRLKITQGKLSKIEKGKRKPSAMDFIRGHKIAHKHALSGAGRWKPYNEFRDVFNRGI